MSRLRSRHISICTLRPKTRLARLSSWGRRWSGLIGIVVAAAAMAGTWYQGFISREHNELSVKPSLRITTYLEGEGGRTGMYLVNSGLGPGELLGLTVSVGDKMYDLLVPGEERRLIRDFGVNLLCFQDTQPEAGSILKPTEEGPLLVITRAKILPSCDGAIALAFMTRSFEFDMKFQSLYGRVFQVKQAVQIDKRAFLDRLPLPKP